MICLICKNLTRALKSADAGYRKALSAPLYFVTTEIAARMQVDMERAKIALSEHQSCCESMAMVSQMGLRGTPAASGVRK